MCELVRGCGCAWVVCACACASVKGPFSAKNPSPPHTPAHRAQVCAFVSGSGDLADLAGHTGLQFLSLRVDPLPSKFTGPRPPCRCGCFAELLFHAAPGVVFLQGLPPGSLRPRPPLCLATAPPGDLGALAGLLLLEHLDLTEVIDVTGVNEAGGWGIAFTLFSFALF